ncbi:UNVERIFIED_CONTAM: hypothetical protein K2H54_066269 [Gekko kuhli]
MEADPVLAVLLAIMAAEAHLQQFKEAAQRWAEVVTAGRLQTCAAWAHFQVMQRVRAKQRQARKRRRIRNLQILGERLPGRRWAVAHQFGLARSTVAGIVVEVTGAITERLLERVVYLRDPDKVICDHTFGQV